MERIGFVQAALLGVAIVILGAPALALAQVVPEGGGGGAWVLALVVGALVVGITIFTMSQRRRGPPKP